MELGTGSSPEPDAECNFSRAIRPVPEGTYRQRVSRDGPRRRATGRTGRTGDTAAPLSIRRPATRSMPDRVDSTGHNGSPAGAHR